MRGRSPASGRKAHGDCVRLASDRRLNLFVRKRPIPNADLRIAFQETSFDAAGAEMFLLFTASKSFVGSSRIGSSASAILPIVHASMAIFMAAFIVAPASCSCFKCVSINSVETRVPLKDAEILARFTKARAIGRDRAVIFNPEKQVLLLPLSHFGKEHPREIWRAVNLFEPRLSTPG